MTVNQIASLFNIEGCLLTHEPLWKHSTFSVGGSADLYAIPLHQDDLSALLATAQRHSVPVFVLGGGSNILVSDKGFRGLVIDMSQFTGISIPPRRGIKKNPVIVEAGTDISTAAWQTGVQGLDGLHWFFSMPGSLGGAVWMNARCYGGQISDIFAWADIIRSDGTADRVEHNPRDWDYKKSPFQTISQSPTDSPAESPSLTIIRAAFNLNPADPKKLKRTMLDIRQNRLDKGHFRKPCAGSAFKNNRNFGAPSGELIDRCGLKGLRHGKAEVSSWHGNIIINTGGARASDIHSLIETVSRRVHEQLHHRLEPEICLVGDWTDPDPEPSPIPIKKGPTPPP